MYDKIAVVGDKDSILAFKAIGLEVFPVDTEYEAKEKIRILARSYAIIFVTEEIAKKAESIILRYKARAYPAIIPIPSNKGTLGMGMAGIKKDVEKAIGSDIIFGREDK